MDFDLSISTQETAYGTEQEFFADVYMYEEDLRRLFTEKEASVENDQGAIYIYPPAAKHNNVDDVGHYDDVLRALGEAYTLIQHLEMLDSAALEIVEKQKIKNTYEFYHEQQKQYR